jgi:hypothetical protein
VGPALRIALVLGTALLSGLAAACGPAEKPAPVKAPEPAPPPAPPFPADLKAAFDADVAEAKVQAEAGAAARKEADTTLKTTKNRAAARPAYKKALDHYNAARNKIVAWAEDPRKTAAFTPEQKAYYIKPLQDESDRYVSQIAQIGNEIRMQ